MTIPPTPQTDSLPSLAPSNESADIAESLAGATTILALGNIVSRILGFAKEIQLANLFGAGRAVDAFQIAITIPRDLYDLAIFGHTNSAVVPVLSEYAAKRDKTELWQVLSALLSLVLVAVSLLMLLIFIFAPQVIALYRGLPRHDFAANPFFISPAALSQGISALSAEAFEQTRQLLRLTAPALLFMSAYAILSACLLSLRRFTRPAFGAAIFNATIMLSTLILAPRIGIEGVAVGWVLGAFAQMLLQLGGLRREARGKIRLLVRGLPAAMRHPGLRKIALLYLPVLATLIVDVLINRPFSYNIASQTGEGNVATMNWATSLREFPMGLVGTAISIAILPTLSQQALNRDLLVGFRATLGRGLRLALTLIVPASVGIFVLAGPLIGLVFERGAFTAANTFEMAVVLRFYMVGIPFAAIDLLLIFAFYAQRDSLTPALVGMFSLACYIGVTLLALPSLGFHSLMVADSLKHFIHMTLCAWLLWRRLAGFGQQQLLLTLLKVSFATALMGGLTWGVARGVASVLSMQGLHERFLLVALPALAGGLAYLLMARLLKLNEFTLFVKALLGKFRRKRSRP
jgi:putative peptidoglycan lipid II flippase